MEKQFDKNDEILKKLIQDSSLEKPSLGFTQNIMDKITATESKKLTYKPLFSKKAWGIVAAVFVIAFIGLYYIPLNLGSAEPVDKALQTVSFELPSFEISRTVVYGIGFLSLFLLQIPFLKRLMIKNY